MSPENQKPSRRAIVAAAASVPVLALPAAAAAVPAALPVGADPIHAAIEAHRQAFIRELKSGWIQSETKDGTPEQRAATKANIADGNVRSAAEVTLANTVPTTTAGAIALLAYVNDFYAQNIVLPEDPEWYSDQKISFGTLTLVDEKFLNKASGEPLELPFSFWIMHNVRIALQNGLAVQS
jgi:hypothetical protein